MEGMTARQLEALRRKLAKKWRRKSISGGNNGSVTYIQSTTSLNDYIVLSKDVSIQNNIEAIQ